MKIDNKLIIKSAVYFCAFFPVFIFSIYNYGFVYGEGAFSNKINSRVESGPYRGLFTTHEKKVFLENFEAMMFNNKNLQSSKILIYDFFAAGYFYTLSRPASPVVWEFPEGWYGATRNSVLKYLENPEHIPSLVIRTKKVPGLMGGFINIPDVNDPLDIYVKSRYIPIEENEWYTVYKIKSEH